MESLLPKTGKDSLGDEHEREGRVAGQLGEVVAVHGRAEAVPLAHKALVGDASRHGDVVEQVPARCSTVSSSS